MIAGLTDPNPRGAIKKHRYIFDKTGPLIDYCYDTMTILPLSNRILVPEVIKPNPGLLKNMGGILVNNEFNAEMEGYITTLALEIGPACVSVKKGDTILIHTDNVNKIEFGGQAAYFIGEQQVLAIVKKDEVEKKTPAVDPAAPGGKRSRKVYPVGGSAGGTSKRASS